MLTAFYPQRDRQSYFKPKIIKIVGAVLYMYFKLILRGFRLKWGFIFKRFQIIYYCIYVDQKIACFTVFFQKLFVLDNQPIGPIYPTRVKNIFLYVITNTRSIIRPPYLLWNICDISLVSPQAGFPRVTYHSLLAS